MKYAQTATITTYTGRKFRPEDVTVDDISPIDIAVGLSNQTRYNGQLSDFYSVAQHCSLMHDYAIEFGCKDIADQMLMHDAAEAYLGDLITPMKEMKQFEYYYELEELFEKTIAERFDLAEVHDPRVKKLDLWIRVAETKYFRPNCKPYKLEKPNQFHGEVALPIVSWSPRKSKDQFMRRMKKIGIRVE